MVRITPDQDLVFKKQDMDSFSAVCGEEVRRVVSLLDSVQEGVFKAASENNLPAEEATELCRLVMRRIVSQHDDLRDSITKIARYLPADVFNSLKSQVDILPRLQPWEESRNYHEHLH